MSRFSPAPAKQFKSAPAPALPIAGLASGPVLPAPVQPNLLQLVAFFALCACLLSLAGFLNEMSIRQFGAKPYLSLVLAPVAAIASVISGGIFKGFRTPIGLVWLALFIAMALSVPFSIWRGDSVRLLVQYGPRAHFFVFYLCAVCVTLKQCRACIYMNILGGLMVVLYCILAGTLGDGRFVVPRSSLSNPNDLALHLLLSTAFFFYLLLQKNLGLKLLGAVAIFLALVFMLKAGSRGTFLSIVILFVTIFAVGSRFAKAQMVVVGLVAAILSVAFMPRPTLRRLVLFTTTPADIQEEEGVGSTIASQVARTQLLKTSIRYALHHPLFGVGFGQFAGAALSDASKQGRHIVWSGTHNAYTQIASECGIPAFILYCAVIFMCTRQNYRLFKESRGKAGLEQLYSMSFCMFLVMMAYAVNTLFSHVAYYYYLPVFIGLSVSLHLVAQPYLAPFRVPSAAVRSPQPRSPVSASLSPQLR